MSRLSIVVPTRDTRDLVVACLESIFRQAGEAPQVVVVDDAGNDDTSEFVARRFPDVVLERNPQPLGFTGSVQRGLARTDGDLVLILNSDTELDPYALPEIDRAFDRHPDLGVAGARLRFPDGTPQWSGGPEPTLLWCLALTTGWVRRLRRTGALEWLRPADRVRARRGAIDSGEPSRSAPVPVDWVTGAAMTIRREVLREVGDLDDSFGFYGQDLDYCTRVRTAGWQCAILPAVSVLHHAGATTSALDSERPEAPETVLWLDILHWGRRHRRPAWTRWARRAMVLGTWLSAAPLGPARRRARERLLRFDPTKTADFR